MYISESFGQRPIAGKQNRRRYPRVKPGRDGRINPEDLSPESVDVSSVTARLKSPWLMAFGGAIVGAGISAIVAMSVQGGPSSAVAEARASKEAPGLADSDPPTDVTGQSRSVAKNRPVKVPHVAALRQLPPDTSAEPVRKLVAPPEATQALAQPDNRDITPAPSSEADALVPMPGPEEDTSVAMVPMPGPESGGETPAFFVVQ